MYQRSLGQVPQHQAANPFILQPWGGPLSIITEPERADPVFQQEPSNGYQPDPGLYGGDTPPAEEDHTLIYVGAAAAAVLGGYLLWRSTKKGRR
jgi:hypothetical protein